MSGEAVAVGRDAIEIFLRLLGPFSVRRGGDEVASAAFGGRLSQALLRLLATRRGAAVPRDVLVDALWPDHPPSDPQGNLSVLASRIRKATGAPWLVTATSGGYLVPTDARCVVDAERFLAEAAEGRRLLEEGEPAAAVRTLETALARWIGEPLIEDLYADWSQPYRAHLHQVRLGALDCSATAALELGKSSLALERSEQAVNADPLRESAHLLQVRALAAAGDPAGAADAYAAFARRLADDTGLAPSDAARSLHQRLLRGELVAAAPSVAVRSRPAPPEIPSGSPFVGRDRELAVALERLQRHEVTTIAGVSGAGKSRLLAEIARRLDRPALLTRAFRAEQAEAWSLARHLLRESLAADVTAVNALPERIVSALADLLPEIAEIRRVPSPVLEPDSRRALMSEGALRLIGSAQHAYLLLDDVQWADPTSLALIGRIRDRLPHLGMVLAYRSEELAADNTLQRLLPNRDVLELAIPPLDQDAIAQLVGDDAVVAALAEHTDRTPMALFEVITALTWQGLLAQRGGRWSTTAPDAAAHAAELARDGQRRAILARATVQPGPARQLLRMLALLARETPARVLADAAGRPQPDVLRALDHLAQAGLVRLGDRGWATAHDLVAESIAANLDAASAGALHAMLANALTRDQADHAEVARHLAGAADTHAAATAYAAAAKERLDRYGNQEAQQLATMGLELNPRAAIQVTLLETRAEARSRAGDLAGAGNDLRQAIGTGLAGPARARLLARRARLAAGSEDLVRAGELVQLALAETAGEPAARAAALYAGGLVDMNTDRPQRAEQRWDDALRLFEQVEDARGVADILDARAMATCLDGRNREAVAAFDRVARLFTDAGNLLRVVTPRSTRGHGLVFLAEPEHALVEIEQALDLARTLDYPEGVSYALWHHCEALAALGRVDEAERNAREALAIAERLGHRSWTASALRALGVALQAQGDLLRAEDAFHRSLELAEHWPLFASWACARIGLIRVACGDYPGAERFVARALSAGPPLAHYEARWARAELAAARNEPDAAETARAALERARQGGHLAAAARLAELAAAGRSASDRETV